MISMVREKFGIFTKVESGATWTEEIWTPKAQFVTRSSNVDGEIGVVMLMPGLMVGFEFTRR